MSEAENPPCVACNGRQELLGVQSIRMGGSAGGWVALFGNWAEGSEWLWDVGLFRCTSCGRFDFYDKDAPATKSALGT